MVQKLHKTQAGRSPIETIITEMKSRARSLELMGWPQLNKGRQPYFNGEHLPGIIHVNRRPAAIFIRKKPNPDRLPDPYADE